MRTDDRKWWDAIQHTPLLDGTGLLTPKAKELMQLFEVTNLEDLLKVIEGTGKGYWYRSDLGRPDVNVSGHANPTMNPDEL